MPEPAEDKIVHNLIEAIEQVRTDMDKVELWTAVLGCFLAPIPEYQPSNKFLLSPLPERETPRRQF
jgi:hypothetical protein